MVDIKKKKEILEMLLYSEFSTFEIAKIIGIEESLVNKILNEN